VARLIVPKGGLGSARAEPLRNIPGPEPHARGDPVVGNEVAGDVAIYRLRADCQQCRQFLCGHEIGIAIQSIEDVGRPWELRRGIRTRSAAGPAPFHPWRDSIACPARSAAHGKWCTRHSPACQTSDPELITCLFAAEAPEPGLPHRNQSTAAVRACGRPETTENSGNKRELTGSQV